MGRIVNQRELSELTGVSTVTLWTWGKEGMPHQPGDSGQENQYDTELVIKWMVERAVVAAGREGEKDRLNRLQADKLEIEIGEMRGELVRADEVEPAWSALVVAVRQELLPLGLRLAPLLETTLGVDAKRELLDEEVHHILSKLSEHDITGNEDAVSAGGAQVRPAAAHPPDAVG